MAWNDFNDAEEQSSSDLIPNKTPVKVVTKIRPGGYNDEAEGLTGGLATQADSGAIYFDCEFTIIGGKYGKRKVWSLIGLHSPKGPKWEQMGKSFIRAMLESARGIAPNDASELGRKARHINTYADLDGMEFAAFVEVQKADPGSSYSDKNVIQTVIPVTHKDYAAIMSGAGVAAATPAASNGQANTAGKPAWAT